jgi:hypothetical protein
MPFVAPKNSWWERKLLDPGKYDATCYSIIDLWSQEIERQWEKKMQRKVLIWFEIHWQYIERDGEKLPLVKSKKYTLSMSEKSNLRKDIKSWYWKDQWENFDLFELLERKAEITVIHNTSKTWVDYDVIDYISMSKHTHELVNPIQKYSIAEHNDVAFNSLYKRQQEIIQASPEFQNLNNLVADDDTDLPF